MKLEGHHLLFKKHYNSERYILTTQKQHWLFDLDDYTKTTLIIWPRWLHKNNIDYLTEMATQKQHWLFHLYD